MENEDTKTDCRTTTTTEQTNEIAQIGSTTISPFCDSRCSVCESGFAAEINAARSSKTLRELSLFLSDEYGIDLSKDQLFLHFKKYGAKLRDESLKKAYEQFRESSNMIAVHQKQTLFLASYAFEEILRRISNGTLIAGVDDFERLLKLYYQILQNPEQAPAQGVAEVLMARLKFGVPIQQQSMDFGSTPEAPEAAPAPEMGRACAPTAGAA